MKEKLKYYLPILISMSMVLGIYIGYNIHKKLPYNSDFFDITHTNKWENLQSLIEKNYVDKITLDSLVEENINNILRQLDPFSTYISSRELNSYNEDLNGEFFGIGVEYNLIEDTMNILGVKEEGPASEAGLEIGDKIISVNDSMIAGVKITNEKVQSYFKGKKGKDLKVKLLRSSKLMTYQLKTNTVPLKSIVSQYMITPEIAYIKFDKFSAHSHAEISQALENLNKQGMKKLVLDLRNNSGGFLNQSVEIADEFLGGDKLITYTEGAQQERKEYKCRRHGLFEEGDMVVLVNKNSASASEVLSGALQDWDRATIVGNETFGKGLVQEQFSLKDGSAIRLTVARYYTPLGRSIQKPYSKIGENISLDTLVKRDTFITPKGKLLYGGGGIYPDYFMKQELDSEVDTAFLKQIVAYGKKSIFTFVFQFYVKHKNLFDSFHTKSKITYTKEIRKMFLSEIENYYFKNNKKDFYKTIQQQTERFLFILLTRYAYDIEAYYRYLNTDDTYVSKALSLLSSTKK